VGPQDNPDLLPNQLPRRGTGAPWTDAFFCRSQSRQAGGFAPLQNLPARLAVCQKTFEAGLTNLDESAIYRKIGSFDERHRDQLAV
jgi:hypothetical protein